MKQEYTISIYTENELNLINKIDLILSRRKIRTESLNISLNEIEKKYRFAIVLNETKTVVKNLILQIEKTVGVLEVYSNTAEEIIEQETALCKVPIASSFKEAKAEQLLKEYGAKPVLIQEDYAIFEAQGKGQEINNLLQELRKYDLIEFVKTCRIALPKSNEKPIGILDIEKTSTQKHSNNPFSNHNNMVFETK